MNTTASKAVRYGFLAERKTDSIPGVDKKSAKDVTSAAVIGAGTMGGGIAVALVEAGIDVKLLDNNPEKLEAGLANCHKIWDRAFSKGRIKQDRLDTYKAALNGAESYDDIAQCDVVIEAVVENMDVKKIVFEALDKVMKPGAILASNTSTLNVDDIALATKRPEDVIGLHFFSPANIMKLLEIVRGAKTSNEVLATSLALAKKLKKIPVVAGVCDGFIANRMIDRYVHQAMYLVEEGATPDQVDKALEKWGMAMGPFRVSDVVGHDIPHSALQERLKLHPDLKYPTIPGVVHDKGWLGQKTGIGWYKYEKGARKPKPNPEIPALIEETSKKLGLTRRKISNEEIVHRCIFALVNEAAAILAEGFAQRGSDIDIAYQYGFGFPGFRGGPLFYADQFGLRSMIREMKKFADNPHGVPEFWTPHALLQELADKDESLSKYEVE
jgi:3-hydroxyacyl-CoA dehydrogenase